ncbi:MAG: nicotinate-nicotinamide nucleotide adenylyltransferase [Planctomycetes bacterium]|nr:nicotinate-nicotinamide nucleotide adenylyltransferase [Planctomycetota bacterium]
MKPETIEALLATLDPAGGPRVVFTAGPGRGASVRRLGVLDASFNPPTHAHLRMLELACEKFGLDGRLLLLAKTNVDKPVFGASLAHRLRMMEILARGLEGSSVGVTAHGRFVDKARALRAAYGPSCSIHLILGFDTLVRLFDPKYYTDPQAALGDLFREAEVLFAHRGGFDPQAEQQLLASGAVKPWASRLHSLRLEAGYAGMSSTEARRRLGPGGIGAEEVVPAKVLAYIREHGLYS